METKYIPQETADQIIKFMEICEEVHPNIAFKVIDTEGCAIYTRNIEKVISEIDGGDEEFGFNIIDRQTKDVLGWFCILPYEEDFICDYSDNDFCKEVYDRLENEFGK
jgi:hypothetical protein